MKALLGVKITFLHTKRDFPNAEEFHLQQDHNFPQPKFVN